MFYTAPAALSYIISTDPSLKITHMQQIQMYEKVDKCRWLHDCLTVLRKQAFH